MDSLDFFVQSFALKYATGVTAAFFFSFSFPFSFLFGFPIHSQWCALSVCLGVTITFSFLLKLRVCGLNGVEASKKKRNCGGGEGFNSATSLW